MSTSRLLVPASQHPRDPSQNAQALGFAVNLDSGRGLLTTRHRRLGPLVVDTLSLEIPHLAFPFDVSGGAARFKKRRCALVALAMHVDAADLLACMSQHEARALGFARLSAHIQEGVIMLAGRFCHADHAADFTCRIAPVVHSGRQVHLVFYDTRVYGFLPMPGAHLARYLWRALRWPGWFEELPALWQLRPIDAFARELLPRGGWKIPAMQNLHALTVTAHQGQIHVACGEAQATVDAVTQPLPTEALQASDGIALNDAAEAALHAGDVAQAYQQLRRSVDDGYGGTWAETRLLQVGAALPQFAVDVRHYAQQFLERGKHTTHARLALAALALQARNPAAAAVHFSALAHEAQQKQQCIDAAAAWLTQSHVQADIDLPGALQAGGAAVGLTPQEPLAHAHMYRLFRKSGDTEQAGQAAERWAQYSDNSPEAAAFFCELGDFFCRDVEDFVKARRMFEQALARVADFPAALSGLAELHLHRGDTAQAVTFFARLAGYWEQAGNIPEAVACHLRLAEVWQHRLGDAAASAARYKKVIELDPTCLHALVSLADLAYEAGHNDQALAHYQAIIARDTQAAAATAPEGAVHAYEQAIKILHQAPHAAHHASLLLAYLDRLCQLCPGHPEASAMRLGFLRSQKFYDRLAQALLEQACATPEPEAACSLFLEAAQLARDHLDDKGLLRRLLESVCDLQPAHAAALEMLLPLLQELQDWEALAAALSSAAHATADAALRTQHLVALAQVQGELHMPASQRVQTLQLALRLAPDDLPAAQAMVDVLESDPETPSHDLALAHETLAQALTAPHEQAQAYMAAARCHATGALAVTAARRAVDLQPESAAAHFLLTEILQSGDDRMAVQHAFAAAVQQITDSADLAEAWVRQSQWAAVVGDTALQVQALQGLAGMDHLTDTQAQEFVQALHHTGQTDRAVEWLEQWADAGAPMHPSDALLLAANMLHAAQSHSRAHDLLQRVLRHPPHYAHQAALAMEQLAKSTRNDAWLAESWRAQIKSAPNEALRIVKQARLLMWQTEQRDPDRLQTARALLQAQPNHPLACHVLAAHYDSEKAWIEGLDVRLAMLGAPPDPADHERRRIAYQQAAQVAADLRPHVLASLQSGFAAEFTGIELSFTPLSEALAAQHQWDDLLTLRRRQHHQDPENVQWQRAIAILLEDHFERADEARHMWQAICVADPHDGDSLQRWRASAERAGDMAALAAAHAALARWDTNPVTAWAHALQSAHLQAHALHDTGAARAVLQDCLDVLPPPAALTALAQELAKLQMYDEVVALAPPDFMRTRQSAAWTSLIEQCLEGLNKPFEHLAYVLHQAPLGTYDSATAAARLIHLMVHCPTARNQQEQSIHAQAHAFCAAALQSNDPQRALEHLRAALAHHPAPQSLLALHEALLIATANFAEVAELHLTEARRAGLGSVARHHFEALANVCESHLRDTTRARWALEQAVAHAPRDAALLQRLLAMYTLPQERGPYVATAEALLAVSTEAQNDVQLLQRLADACADIDRGRAITLLRSAMTIAPDDSAIRERWQTLSRAEATTAAEAHSLAIAAHERHNPQTVDPVLQNIEAWQAAVNREPRNLAYRERYAAACAQSPAHLATAREVYVDLLQRDCTHTPWLRVLARLDGALHDSNAAYHFYAALLAVQPADAEAQRFVHACRQLRPTLPARPFGDDDRQALQADFTPHPQHTLSTEPVIAPRALSTVAPTDPKMAPLVSLLRHLGVPVPRLCLWPAGGRQCAMTAEGATLMVGAALYADQPNRGGLFLALRAVLQAQWGALHPAHANHAALLLTTDVAEAIDALCAAYGMVLAPQASRAALIKKTPELVDLLRFAQSPLCLKLRREL